MTKCLNCCGQSFDGQMCPNCGHPAYKMGLDRIPEILGPVIVDARSYGGFSSVGPLHYQTQGLLSYATSGEWIAKAMCHPTLAVLFCRPDDAPDCDISLVLSDNPARDFVRYHNWLALETQFYDRFAVMIHKGAQVHDTAVLAENVSIGENTIIGPHTAIGMNGARYANGFHGGDYVVHVGGVRIGSHCAVGAGAVIVRSVWGDTTIGNNCWIGQLVSIGHNCRVGDGCMILPGAVLSGSVTVGNGVIIGPNATVSDHVTIGDGAKVTLGAVVTKDVEPGEVVSGNFAVEHNKLIEFVKRIAKGER